MEKIDFVVTWVDGNDPVWQKEKSKYSKSNDDDSLNTDARYREMDLMRFWFRSIEKNVPWVNKIFFVTEGHVPGWLNLNHPKICLVKHSDFIPKEYLPTFSSNVIELNLYRIKELSEYFVLFSDDVFVNREVSPQDFFKNNVPRLLGVYRPIIPNKEFSYVEFNNIFIVNKYLSSFNSDKKRLLQLFSPGYGKYNLFNFFSLFYKGIIGYENQHVAMPSLKSTYQEIWELESKLLHKQCKRKFRTKDDVNHWLMSYWNIENMRFHPQNLKFGKYIPLSSIEEIRKIINQEKLKLICINDDERTKDFDVEVELVRNLFESKYPDKSKFEL